MANARICRCGRGRSLDGRGCLCGVTQVLLAPAALVRDVMLMMRYYTGVAPGEVCAVPTE
jgi:hypothetical protein